MSMNDKDWGEMSDMILKKTANELLRHVYSSSAFSKFCPEPEPVSRMRRYLNRIARKVKDIKVGYRIIFKGKI